MKFFEVMNKLHSIKDFEEYKKAIAKGLVKVMHIQIDNKLIFSFPKGVTFKCTQCGNCCHGDVPLNREEVDSKIFKMKKGSKVCYSMTDMFIEGEHKQPCIYLKDNKCTIYDTRPKRCREFPWIPNILLARPFAFMLYLELTKGRECKGFHIGEMKEEHIAPFVEVLGRTPDIPEHIPDNFQEMLDDLVKNNS